MSIAMETDQSSFFLSRSTTCTVAVTLLVYVTPVRTVACAAQTSECLISALVRWVNPGRNGGGCRNQMHVCPQIPRHPCSSRHPSWSLLLLLWSRYNPLPLWSM